MTNWIQCVAVYAIFSSVAFVQSTDGNNCCGLVRKKKNSSSSTESETVPQVATDIQYNTDTSCANYNAAVHHSTPNDSLKIPPTPNQIESISGLKPKDMTGIFYQEGEHRYKANNFVQVLTGKVHDAYKADIMISIEESSSSGSSSSSSDEEHKKKKKEKGKKKNKGKNDEYGDKVNKDENDKIIKENSEENMTTKDVECKDNGTTSALETFEQKELDNNSELKKTDIDEKEEKFKQKLASLPINDVACMDIGTTSGLVTFEIDELDTNPELKKTDIDKHEEKFKQEMAGLPINDVANTDTGTTSALATFEIEELDTNSELKKTHVDEHEEKVKQEMAGLQIYDAADTDNLINSALDTFEQDALDNNSELIKTDIDDIEEKVKQTPELAGLQIKRKEIIIFLHSAKYEAERAYKMIVANYQYRIVLQLFFQKLDLRSELMRRVPETLCFSILPIEYGRDNECHIYVAFLKFDLVDFDYENTVRYFFMLIEYLLKSKGTFKGITVYLNAKGVTREHLTEIPPNILFKLLKFVQAGLPVRLISINVININHFFKMVLKGLLWISLKPPIKKKIHFYTTAQELSKKTEMINIWPHMPLEIQGQGKSQAEQSIHTYEKLLKVNEWYLHKQKKFKMFLDRTGQLSDDLKANSESVNEDDDQMDK